MKNSTSQSHTGCNRYFSRTYPAGDGFFGVAVTAQSQGHNQPMDLFQTLWQPLFTPAISLLIMAALLSGIISWWQRRVLKPDRGNGN